ncbi:MAG: hypothetical protein WCF26_06990 [Candidatus Sulfotelmatobacter sp.]
MKWKTLLLFCLFATAALAQTSRIPIWVEAKTSDAVGRSFVYQLREEIAHSALYSLADTREKTLLVLYIVSTSPAAEDANNSASAVSMVLLWETTKCGPIFLNQFVSMVGLDKTHEITQRLMAQVDAEVQADLKALGLKQSEGR